MHITIRAATHRGKRGFSITAIVDEMCRTRIFVQHLSTAEAIKAAYRAGRERDWEYIDGLIREDAA